MSRREYSPEEVERHNRWLKTVNTDWFYALRYHSMGWREISGPIGPHLERLNRLPEDELYDLYKRHGFLRSRQVKKSPREGEK